MIDGEFVAEMVYGLMMLVEVLGRDGGWKMFHVEHLVRVGGKGGLGSELFHVEHLAARKRRVMSGL